MQYLGINVADTPDDAAAFVDGYGWSWPQMQDPGRDRARQLGATYQPHFILLDDRGGGVAAWEGGGGDAVWSAMLAKLP